MTIAEALEIIKKQLPANAEDFFIEKDELHWQHDFGNVDEPGDVAWDTHCEVSACLRTVFGEDKIEIDDAWADNDTVGFTIKLK